MISPFTAPAIGFQWTVASALTCCLIARDHSTSFRGTTRFPVWKKCRVRYILLITRGPFSMAMPTDDPRCPYCIDRDAFRLLTPAGNVFRCSRCDHMWKPANVLFLCRCENCEKMRVVKKA